MAAMERSFMSVRPPRRAEGFTTFASVHRKSLLPLTRLGLRRMHTRGAGRGPLLGGAEARVPDGYTRSHDAAAGHAPGSRYAAAELGSPSRTFAAANPWRSHPTAENLPVMTALHSDWPRTRAPSSRPPNEITVAIRRRDAELRAVIAEHREGS
jgi:hypothetical protein